MVITVVFRCHGVTRSRGVACKIGKVGVAVDTSAYRSRLWLVCSHLSSYHVRRLSSV